MIKSDFLTRFVFNDSVIVELSSDYVDTVMVEVLNKDDPEDGGRSFQLETDEIDLMIAALTVYKNRIKQGDRKS